MRSIHLQCCMILTVLAAVLFSGGSLAGAQHHKLAEGETIPAFSCSDIDGERFSYRPGETGENRIFIFLFLSRKHERSVEALSDVRSVLTSLKVKERKLTVFIVVHELWKQVSLPEGTSEASENITYRILLDKEYKVWNKFGIIATPSIVIAGTNHKVAGSKAGYSYNFAPFVKTCVSRALGRENGGGAGAGDVKAVDNTSDLARAGRHLQMAEILLSKGKTEAAAGEVAKARKLAPEAVTISLNAALLLCRARKPEAALKALEHITPSDERGKALYFLVSGWAHELSGTLVPAEQHLLKAAAFPSVSGRALYELGKIYQEQGKTEKAAETYRKALSLIFSGKANVTVSHR